MNAQQADRLKVDLCRARDVAVKRWCQFGHYDATDKNMNHYFVKVENSVTDYHRALWYQESVENDSIWYERSTKTVVRMKEKLDNALYDDISEKTHS